ncbi:MAG: cytochrome c oxidase subunit II transmembrane domain-containing protein, partial [Gammaproteobacteria bacterium]
MAAIALQSGAALAEQAAHSSVNMRRGVTEVGHEIYDLHMFTLWVCVAIGVVVFGVMFYSIFAHRKSRGAVAAHFHESTKLEIAWTVVPFLI